MSSYNLESVQEMAGDDHDFVKIVVQTFLEEIPADLEAMNQAVEQENPAQAYQYAHKMKPNFQMFGLKLLPQIKILEEWTKDDETKADVVAAARIITKKYYQAEAALKKDFQL